MSSADYKHHAWGQKQECSKGSFASTIFLYNFWSLRRNVFFAIQSRDPPPSMNKHLWKERVSGLIRSQMKTHEAPLKGLLKKIFYGSWADPRSPFSRGNLGPIRVSPGHMAQAERPVLRPSIQIKRRLYIFLIITQWRHTMASRHTMTNEQSSKQAITAPKPEPYVDWIWWISFVPNNSVNRTKLHLCICNRVKYRWPIVGL
jgi:hypothetical protein